MSQFDPLLAYRTLSITLFYESWVKYEIGVIQTKTVTARHNIPLTANYETICDMSAKHLNCKTSIVTRKC